MIDEDKWLSLKEELKKHIDDWSLFLRQNPGIHLSADDRIRIQARIDALGGVLNSMERKEVE